MRIAFIGDVHGRAVELMRMLVRLEKHGCDRIIQLGDLTDRGPSSVECVRIARTWTFTARNGKQRCLEVILSNHEENHLYAHYKRVLPFRDFVPKTQHPDVTEGLSEHDYRWLDRLPHMITIRDKDKKFVAVHGGFAPWMKTPGWFGKYKGSLLCRIGYFGPKGEILSPYQSSSRFWANEYDGRFGEAFFGHTSHDKVTKYDHAVAVDTSKRGKLAAVVRSTDPDDQEYACFYEEHESHYPRRVSETHKPDDTRRPPSGGSGGSSSSNFEKKGFSSDSKTWGKQLSLYELEKRPSVDPPKDLPPKASYEPSSKDEFHEPGDEAGDEWLKKAGIDPGKPMDW